MQSLVIASANPDTRSLIRRIALKLETDCRELELETLLTIEAPLEHDFLFVEADPVYVYRLSVQLHAQGIDPRRCVVRLIDQPWARYFYHDLPVFASVISPTDETETIEIFQRLKRAVGVTPPFHAGNVLPVPPDVVPLSGDETAEQILKIAHDLAPMPVDVLLIGETGVGKDALTKEMHELSGRPGDLVAVNCAAIPEALAESELFGVEAGAFTGAAKSRPGRIEAAHRGTLYLDEIDSMPIHLQAKLLRALQERGTERLGSHKFIPAEFRVIASTKVPLDSLVSQGKFRQDLMYRLNVVALKIPPLRERPGSILKLFRRFTEEAALRFGRPAATISGRLERQLLTYSWPGNVRELKAAADRYALQLDPMPNQSVNENRTLKDMVRDFERSIILAALTRHAGSVQQASEDLQTPLPTLYYRMKSLGIERGEES